MIEKILSTSCLGMLLGYLSGYNLYYSSSLIKLSLVLFVTSFFFFLIFIKTRKDIFLKNTFYLVSIFLLVFFVSSVRGNVLKKDFVKIDETVEISIRVYDILSKDSTKIIKGEVVENKNIQNPKIENLRNIVIYTFSQENFYPDMILNIKGKLTNEIILLPKKENIEEGGGQNNGRSFDLFHYWSTQRIDAITMYPIIKKENIADPKDMHSIYFYSYKFRNYFSESLKKVMDSFDVGIVMAMLWGDENNISKETNNIFRGAGVSHILVLSGYNLSIVSILVAFLFKKSKLKTKVILSLIAISIFLCLAHTSSSVWRAAVMSSYTLLAVFFLKPSNAKVGLWVTCFLFFIYSPLIAMRDISFHLSFLATSGIIYFYPALENIIKSKYFTKNKSLDKNKKRKIEIETKNVLLENIVKVFLVTISVNILIAPYLIYQFGYFKISSIFFSFLITPFVPFVMFFGFLSGSFILFSETLKSFFYFKHVSDIFYYISKIFSMLTEIFTNIIFLLTKYSNTFSNTHSSSFSFSYLIISYLIIIFIFNYLNFLSKTITD